MLQADTTSPADLERFTRLYNAHLAQASTSTATAAITGYRDDDRATAATIHPSAELDAFQASLSAVQRDYVDQHAERLRRAFHSHHEQRRQAQLHSLLIQLPPFSLSDSDRQRRRSAGARRRRRAHLSSFAATFATPQNVGVRPFFAALRRLLEAQARDHAGRPFQWLLDDAVLMETGGEDFTRAAVYTLKAVLYFDEYKPADANPFDDATIVRGRTQGRDHGSEDVNVLRVWTLPSFLSNLECASLARAVPSHVLPRRGCGSKPVYADDGLLRLARDESDEERQAASPIALPTGSLRYAPRGKQRDADFRGGWMQWLLDCMLSVVRLR